MTDIISQAKLGLVVFASQGGLGYQTLMLYKKLKPKKVLLVDISSLNHMEQHLEWYKDINYIKTNGFPTNREIEDFLIDLKSVWVCETPLNYHLFQRAKSLGVTTVHQPNYEFYEKDAPRADIIVAPSQWHLEEYEKYNYRSVSYLPLPLDETRFVVRSVEEVKTFFHVAGRPAENDRNGTFIFINAVKRLPVRMNARYLLYCQKPTPEIRMHVQNTRIQLIENIDFNGDLYSQGEIMILPRRYGGQSLVLNEAIGTGIPVLMPDIDPNNKWLPKEWLLPVSPITQNFRSKSEIAIYNMDSYKLALKMIELYQHPELVKRMHEQAVELREQLLWKTLKPEYEFVLETANG